MRIICSVGDYYDGVQQSVGDTEDRWYRNPELINLVETYDSVSRTRVVRSSDEKYRGLEPLFKQKSILKAISSERLFGFDYVSKVQNVSSLEFHRTLMYFCGKLYAGLGTCVVTDVFHVDRPEIRSRRISRNVFWTEDQVLHFCKTNRIQFRNEEAGPFWRDRYEAWNVDRRIPRDKNKPFEPLLAQLGREESPDLLNLALTLNMPIVAFGYAKADTPRIGTGQHRTAVVDAILNDYDFFRLFPASQAYQELMMFKGAIANPAPPMVELTDKDKQTKFGFTHQYSFKKEPGGRKGKRSKNK